MNRHLHVVALISAVGASALWLTACGSAAKTVSPAPRSSVSSSVSGSASSATTQAPSTSVATVTATVQAPATSPAAADSSASPSTPRCSTSNSTVTAVSLGPAGGSFYLAIRVTNHGSTPCVTGGFPGVAVLDGSGGQQFQATRDAHGGTGDPITLGPGQTASAELSGGDHHEPGGTDCPDDSGVLVTPPDTTVSVPVSIQIPACGPPAVQPLKPGLYGNGQ